MGRAISAACVLGAISLAASTETQAAGPLGACMAPMAERLNFEGVVSVAQPRGDTIVSRGVIGGPGSAAIGPNTRFNLASAGKMFTAVAVAQLVDERKVGLDDPIWLYVPNLPAPTGAVTVRQFLTHSGGLGDYFTPDNFPAIRDARSTSDLFALIRTETPAFAPGSRFEYSNSGFVLLGLMIERVSGESYGDYLQRHIFTPAGMTASGLAPGPSADRAVGMTTMAVPSSRVATGGPRLMRPSPGPIGAAPRGPLREAGEASIFGGPAGGSYSSVADMQRFFKALMHAKLVSPLMLSALTSKQIVAAPAGDGHPELDYGLGMGVGIFNGHRWFGHNGGAPGVNTELFAYPDDQAAIVVLSDRDPPTGSMLFRQVRAAALQASCS